MTLLKEKNTFILNLLFLFLFWSLASCVGGEGGKEKANCSSGQTFDNKTRSCKGATVGEQPPTLTLNDLSLIEDAGTVTKTLSYVDSSGDLATQCRVTTNGPGLLRSTTAEGVSFNLLSGAQADKEYQIILSFPHDGFIEEQVIVTDPLGLNLVTIEVIVGISGTTNSQEVANAINGAVAINTQMSASMVIPQLSSAIALPKKLEEIACRCIGKICITDIATITNFNGPTFFDYSLSDNDGSSLVKRVSVNVTAVNDAPVVVVNAINAPTVTEGPTGITGNLLTGAVISIDDSADGDPTCANCILEVVSGSVALETFVSVISSGASKGNFSFSTEREINPESFSLKVIDTLGLGAQTTAVISVNVNTVNDDPIASSAFLSETLLEDGFSNNNTQELINLPFTDEESDTALACSVVTTNGVFVSTDCSCTGVGPASTCSVGIKGLDSSTSSGSFSYVVETDDGANPNNVSAAKTVSINFVGVEDKPQVFHTISSINVIENSQTIQTAVRDDILDFDESSTHIPNVVTFSLTPAKEHDNNSVTYSLVSGQGPTQGSLTGCMGGSSLGFQNCVYTPNSGNHNNGATFTLGTNRATRTIASSTPASSGVISSKQYGATGNDFSIEFIDSQGRAGSEVAFVVDNVIKVIYEDGVSVFQEIKDAIDNSATAKHLVEFDVTGVTTNTFTFDLAGSGGVNPAVLSGGTDAADSFVYEVRDSNAQTSVQRRVHISIQPVDDKPVLCEFSSIAETSACGLNGCIGSSDPMNGASVVLTPDKDGLSFYNESNGSCWLSSSGIWNLVESHLNDITINELNTIVVDKIRVNEGGSGEEAELLNISGVTSSNDILIPVNNIVFKHGGVTQATGVNFGDGSSEDLKGFSISITPTSGQVGSSEIEVTLTDNGATPKEVEVVFTVTVNPNSATHGGWISFKSTGPKINQFNQLVEDRNHCPYTQNGCESGQSCAGSTTPIGNSSADPDSADSVYLEDTGSGAKCFRQNRTAVQEIAYVAKTSAGAKVVYVDGAVAAGSESINVTSGVITITIKDNESTTNNIITALNDGVSTEAAEARALVKFIKLKDSETQDIDTTGVTIAGLSNSNWIEFSTHCPVTSTTFESGCSGLSCIDSGAPSFTPSKSDSFYWDEENDECYRSIDDSSSADWEKFNGLSEIEISWNPFSVNGSGSISEYQVFRKSLGGQPSAEEFDYSRPINRELISGTGTTFKFIDGANTSLYPPAPGTAYLYEVRPVITSGSDNVLTATTETFINPRIMSPLQNTAFIHQWMANKTMCELMHKTTRPSKNFNCLYTGPGDTLLSGENVYDVGGDFIVDRFEAGCPFTPAPACPSTSDNSCVGIGDPNGNSTTVANAVFYDRDAGKCYINTGGTTWIEFNNAGFTAHLTNNETLGESKNYSRAHLPPLTFINQSNSRDFCADGKLNITGAEILGISSATLATKLPSRKEQVVYAQWNTDEISDSNIATLETGLSLNSTSKCNSSAASGLEASFSDVDSPDSNNFFSLSGTQTSNIRSLITGSTQTEGCVSKFGAQDTSGNVAEWSIDRISCANLSECSMNTTEALVGNDHNSYKSQLAGGDVYAFWGLNGVQGPCVDADADGNCDSNIDTWAFEDERFSAGRIIVPLGLPAHSDFLGDNPTSLVELLEIGPTSGLTSSQLHDDVLAFNTKRLFAATEGASVSGCGGFASGGHFSSGNGAGSWNFETIPCFTSSFGSVTVQDISIKSLSSPAQSLTFQIVDNGVSDTGTDGVVNVTCAGDDVVVDLDTLTGAVIRADSIVTRINAVCGAKVFAAASGDATRAQSAFGISINLENFESDAVNNRVNVGFRCITPILDADYETN
jgi:hypothetical protein